jgi:hypothetical protein
MKRFVIPVLMIGLLAGCSLLPSTSLTEPSQEAIARRMEFANKEMQVRLQYSDWLLASHPQQRMQERQRLAGATDLESRVSLAMVNTHPSESVASRRAGLDQLKALLPELVSMPRPSCAAGSPSGRSCWCETAAATIRVRR